MKFYPVIFFLIAGLAIHLKAQQLNFYTINEKDNLPSNEVYQVLQNYDGHMYIGCSTGLFTYDGYSFRPISGKGQNAKSISHLIKEKNGTIWCQNFAGQIYFVRNDSLILFRDFSEQDISIPPFTLYERDVWIGLPDKLIRIKPSGEEVHFQYPNGVTWSVSSISANSGKIYITEAHGFYTFSIESHEFTLIETGKKNSNQRCNSFSQDNNVFIFCENNPIRNYDLTWMLNGTVAYQGTIPHDAFAHENYFLRKVENGSWLCTSNGAFFFGNNDFSSYQHHLFKGENVSYVFPDQEGNLWFTTLSDGIHVVPSTQFMIINEPGSQSKHHVTAFHATPLHDKFFGTINGDVYKISPKHEPIELPSTARNLYRRVTGMVSYQDKLIVARGVLSVFDKRFSEQVFSLPYIRDMVLMDSLLYIASSGEFGVFNLSTNKYQTIRKTPVRKISGNLHTKEIAITGNNGVEIFSKGEFKKVLDNGNRINATAIRYTYSSLWLGSMDGQVLSIDDNEITHRIVAPNFRGATVLAMFSRYDDLYFSTEAGLHLFNLTNDSLRFFGKRLMADFQGVNMIREDMDTIYLATQSGLYLFPKKIVSKQDVSLPINITHVSVNGVDQTDLNDLHVPYGKNLQINFKSISFTCPNAVSYSYRLKGSSDKWTQITGAQDHVVFESLKSGEYVFEVRAVNSDGIVSLTSSRLTFTIIPPFWKRGWFIISASLSVCGALFLFFIYRIHLIRKKNYHESQLIKSQLTAIKAQMNPHFMYNALNSIQDLIIQHDVSNSSLYLGKFSSLMRMVLDVSAEEFISLQTEIDILQLYLDLEKLRFGSDFTFKIHVGENISPDQIAIPPLLLQPFVENAIKHGLLHKKGDRNLTILFDKKDKITCTILDNGVGRAKAAEIKSRNSSNVQGFATQATQKRIDLLNQYADPSFGLEIKDLFENEKPVGTKVILSIPLHFMN